MTEPKELAPMNAIETEMAQMSADALADYAAEAFRAGFLDAKVGGRQMERNRLALALRLPSRLVIHTDKMRQVYGAGYDIGRVHARIERGV